MHPVGSGVLRARHTRRLHRGVLTLLSPVYDHICAHLHAIRIPTGTDTGPRSQQTGDGNRVRRTQYMTVCATNHHDRTSDRSSHTCLVPQSCKLCVVRPMLRSCFMHVCVCVNHACTYASAVLSGAWYAGCTVWGPTFCQSSPPLSHNTSSTHCASPPLQQGCRVWVDCLPGTKDSKRLCLRAWCWCSLARATCRVWQCCWSCARHRWVMWPGHTHAHHTHTHLYTDTHTRMKPHADARGFAVQPNPLQFAHANTCVHVCACVFVCHVLRSCTWPLPCVPPPTLPSWSLLPGVW